MNRAMSIILSFLMIFGCIGAEASESDMGQVLEEAVWNVKSAGLMQGYEDGEFHPEREISRAEFSAVASRLCGILTDIGMSKTKFSDVTESHWAGGYINAAQGLGLIDGYEDQTFRPDESLTHEQALKIIVCALGYRQKAETMGGYPTGYYVTATGLGITSGVYADMKSRALRGDVAMYLNNALDVRPLENVYSGGGEQYVVSDITMAEKLASYRDTERVEGVVSANHITGLSGESNLSKDEVVIDGKIYNTGNTNISDYLGYMVDMYVTNTTDKVPLIVSFRVLTPKDCVLVLDVDMIDNIDKNKLTYYKDDKETREISLSSTENIIYNGKSLARSLITDSNLQIAQGEYKLIDSDENKRYETLVINEYESFVVDRVYDYGKIIYFANEELYNGKSGLKLFDGDEDYVHTIEHEDGSAATFGDISSGSVVTLCASLDLKVCKVIISDKKVSGKITQIDFDGREIYIDEIPYKLALREDESSKFEPVLGAEAVFVIDCFDKIVATDGRKLASENYAYVVDVKPGGFAGGAMLKLVGFGTHEKIIKKTGNTEEIYHEYRNDDIRTISLASRVVLNGNAVDSDKIDVSDFASCIIGYKCNPEGEIRNINLYAHKSEKYNLLFNADIISFGGYTNSECFFVGTGTSVICVPDFPDSDDDYLEMLRLSDDSQYSCLPVNIDDTTQTAEAVLIFGNMDADAEKPVDDENGISVVGSVSSFIDEDGTEKMRLEVLTGDELSSEICSESSAASSVVSKLRKGDLIRYSLNVKGEVDKVEKLASIQGLTKYYIANRNSPSEEVYGQALSVKLNRLSSTENEIVDEIEIMLGDDESANVIKYSIPHKEGPEVYLYERKSGNIYTGMCDDIETFENVGNAASEVFMLVKSNVPEVVVIIND